VFVFFFLRFKYGPPILVLAGVALMVVGAGVRHYVATGVVGAALVIIGAAVGITRKRRGDVARDRDEDPRAMIRSTDAADDARSRAEVTGTGR
jgi:hypothetical protein